MKKLISCTVCLFIILSASVFAQPVPIVKESPAKKSETRYVNPLQEVNIIGEVFTKGKGTRQQIFIKDELGEEYILKVDDAYSQLYYEDLFVYDGYTVRIVGTLDTRTSVIEVRLIRIREVPVTKKKTPVAPKKEEVKAPKKEEAKAPKKEPAAPKKDTAAPKKEETPKAPKK